MKRVKTIFLGCSLLASCVPGAWAQTSAAEPPSPGWHRFGENNNSTSSPQFAQALPYAQAPQAAPLPAGPAQFTIPAGTWITARVNDVLSSEYNQAGDAFTATLAQPLVVNGLVVARRGQTIGGRVSDVQKSGRVKGLSRLGVELTELTLVDGQQVPMHTQFVERQGNSSVGRDVGTIGTTTGLGAAIGAIAGGGLGAGIGALAGAAVGTTGVLATRGRETVLYPETAITFRLMEPLMVTSQVPQAFQPPSANEYDRQPVRTVSQQPQYPAPSPYAAPYPAYGSPWYYPGYYGFGPSFYFYGGRYGYRGGFRRW